MRFRDVLPRLRSGIKEIQAILLVGPHGILDHVVDDPGLHLETIAGEYATLLRVARSASQDSGSGNLLENIVVSENSVMIARNVSPDYFLILLARSRDQIGRARYELRQAALQMGNPGT